MNLSQRRTVFVIFLVIFVIIAFLIVMYSIGWRLNFQNRTLNKVGALSITTIPSGSQVYLNGKLLTRTTPCTINNLLPNVYSLKISQKGFQPWETKVNIYPSTLVRLDEVTLLKNFATPKKIHPGNYIFSFKQMSDRIILFGKNQLEIFSANREEILFTVQLNEDISKIIPNNERNSFLIQTDNNIFYYLDPDFNELINLNSRYKIEPQWMDWDLSTSDTIIFTDKNQTYSLKINGLINSLSKNSYLYSNGLIDVSYQNNKILIEKDGKNINSISFNGSEKATVKKINNEVLYISSNPNAVGFIYIVPINQFYTWNRELSFATFDESNMLVLINNSNEVWYIDLKKMTENLVVRTSVNITSSNWMLDDNYIEYIDTGNQWHVVGMKNNDYGYLVDIPDLVNSFNFDNLRKNIFITKDGIYKISY